MHIFVLPARCDPVVLAGFFLSSAIVVIPVKLHLSRNQK
jgi:hypothetical protein